MVNMKNSISVRYQRSNGSGFESGVALVMALICLFVMSTLAVGILYSTQGEIWTTANYRAATQARYIAEAGAQQALNYLQTVAPITTTTSTFPASFNLNGMPITYTSTSATLVMSTTGISSKYGDTYSAIDSTTDTNFKNYFSAAVTQTPFAGMAPGCSGSACPHFDVAVQLLTAISKGSGQWLTRWKIVSEGTLNTIGSSNTQGHALVQVVEVVDNVMVYSGSSSTSPTYSAGVFATNTGCAAISMAGGQYTNSYVGATQVGVTSPTLANTGGDVATFGNVKITNGAYIIGNVFTPHYNVGTTGTYGISGGPYPGLNGSAACSTATGGTEYAVNEDNSGSGVGCTGQSASKCSQKTYNLPSPAPSFPTPIMPTVATNTAACTGFNGLCAGGSGGGSGCAITIPPSTLPNGTAGTGAANFGKVNFGSCAVITLQAGTYNMDSLLISNGAKVILPGTGNVVINILDQGSTNSCNGSATPLCVNGGTVANDGGIPNDLTIVYAGTKPIYLDAGANMFASIYAPNSAATIDGNAGLYGAIVLNTATFAGSGHVIYDTSLTGTNWNVNTGTPSSSPGNLHVDEFSWSAF